MAHEVLVVGGGIGGLTAAALLAARGMDVCLLERQPHVGGCVASFEKFGYTFEPTLGLYPFWRPGEIHDRVFAELSVPPPEVRSVDPAYDVRLPDGSQMSVTNNSQKFIENLKEIFPECAEAAIQFYKEISEASEAVLRALRRVPDLPTASKARQIYAFLPSIGLANHIRANRNTTLVEHLAGTSARFQRFIDVQLQAFTQTPIADCAYAVAAVTLSLPRQGMFAIRGGANALAESLMRSIENSGGTIRLDTPVLRLSYDPSGRVTGIDLLSGETITAKLAIVSNMTVWDTYGKLIGLNRTPLALKKRLGSLRGSGAYMIYASLAESAATRISAEHVLAVCEPQEKETGEPSQFAFATAPTWDSRAPEGMRAATVYTATEVDEWFTFQEDESEHERRDQAALERLWQSLHLRMPELGADIEVIETATPRTYYDLTRRRLGIIGFHQLAAALAAPPISHRTFLPNVFMVGNTTFPGPGLAVATHSALVVANELIRLR